MDPKQQQLDAVEAMLEELGINADGATGSQLNTSGPRAPGVSAGPGLKSSGPGLKAGHISSGPGAAASRGPGLVRVPTGPAGIVPATHTPSGQVLSFNGPPCAGCNQMIIGPVINAMEKTWHPEHFVCTQCGRSFPENDFLEHEGKPYCEADYNELFGPKCTFCNGPITETIINALGRSYHPEHFFCTGCNVELRGKQYKEHEGMPYCTDCKAARTVIVDTAAGICAKCKKPIIGEYLVLNGQRMHPEHFRCEECGCEFKNGNCHEYEGLLYCYPDYLKLLKQVCAFCQKPIMGRSVTAIGRVWHPEHFMCHTCKEPFGGSTFFEQDGKAYCQIHYYSQFGKVCQKCNKPCMDNWLMALGKHYHKEHFVCAGCDQPLGREFHDFESKAMCKKCYEKLPKEVRKRIEKKKEGDKKAVKEREKIAAKEEKAAAKEAKKAAKAN